MSKQVWARGAMRLIGVALAATALTPMAQGAGKASAVTPFDLNRYMGTWYEVARLPNKIERRCLTDNMVLYALGDRKNSFQIGISCLLKGGTPDEYDNVGKMNKAGIGKLKLNRLVLFSTPYWVLALGPNYEWAAVGSPNHKTLWILSRNAHLEEGTLTQIKGAAAAQGFDVSKLITVTHHP